MRWRWGPIERQRRQGWQARRTGRLRGSVSRQTSVVRCFGFKNSIVWMCEGRSQHDESIYQLQLNWPPSYGGGQQRAMSSAKIKRCDLCSCLCPRYPNGEVLIVDRGQQSPICGACRVERSQPFLSQPFLQTRREDPGAEPDSASSGARQRASSASVPSRSARLVSARQCVYQTARGAPGKVST